MNATVLSPGELLDTVRSARDRDGYARLSLLTACDTGEALEIVYVLIRPADRASVTFKVPLGYDSPAVPSLSGLWSGADWLEREVFDLFGVRFEGHSDLRRIVLEDDFAGHPLLKSYDRRGAVFEPSTGMIAEEDLASASPGAAFLERLDRTDAIRTEKIVLNMGPQHPSTHGVLHVLLALQGEMIVAAEPSIGYLHRCIEKLCESRTYRACIPLMDRADYVSGFHTELAFCMAAERLAGLEIPRKADYLRVIFSELCRISSHLVWLGAYGLDLGAFTPFLYAFREREVIVDLFEAASGGRMMFNYFRPGGVKDDLPAGLADEMGRFLRAFDSAVDEYDEFLTGSEILMARTRGVGIQTPALLEDYCVTGPALRGSGVAGDLRVDGPYAAYDELEVQVPTGTVGDCFDRYAVRLAEMRSSARIALAALEGLPEGPHICEVPRVFKPPAGEAYELVESPRGELGVYLVSDGTANPMRCKLRSPAFSNLSIIPAAFAGQRLPDAVAIAGAVDVVMGEIDR